MQTALDIDRLKEMARDYLALPPHYTQSTKTLETFDELDAAACTALHELHCFILTMQHTPPPN